MRVLFSSLAGHGHTYPLVPLAVATRAAGHDVLFATDTDLLAVLARFDLRVVRAGISLRRAFTDPGLGAPADPSDVAGMRARSGQVFAEVMPRATATELLPVIEEFGPDLVVEEIMNPGAGLAARHAGVPVITHGFGRISAGMFGWLWAGAARVAQDLGWPEGPTDPMRTPVVDLCPSSLQDPAFVSSARRVPLRPQALRVPGEGVDFRWGADRPLVYLTLGTAFGSADVLRVAVEGLAGLDVEVLVAVGPRVQPGELVSGHPNVRVEAWVPQADVLGRAALVVHHGGSGTMWGAAAAGVPQLFLPQGADQFDNAELITTYGSGRRLLGAEVNAATIAATARLLLVDAATRAQAERLAEEIERMPSPAEVAAQLPELALQSDRGPQLGS